MTTNPNADTVLNTDDGDRPCAYQITFWPELKRHLEDPSSSRPPDVRCTACMEPLRIRGIKQNIIDADTASEPCCVLPCGHLIGKSCLELHIGSYRRLSHDSWARDGCDVPSCPSCPLCRMDLLFRDCKDVHWGRLLPADENDDFDFDVPALLKSAEDMPKQCHRCHTIKKRSLVNDLLGHLLNGHETVPGYIAVQERRLLRQYVDEMDLRVSDGSSWADFDR